MLLWLLPLHARDRHGVVCLSHTKNRWRAPSLEFEPPPGRRRGGSLGAQNEVPWECTGGQTRGRHRCGSAASAFTRRGQTRPPHACMDVCVLTRLSFVSSILVRYAHVGHGRTIAVAKKLIVRDHVCNVSGPRLFRLPAHPRHSTANQELHRWVVSNPGKAALIKQFQQTPARNERIRGLGRPATHVHPPIQTTYNACMHARATVFGTACFVQT